MLLNVLIMMLFISLSRGVGLVHPNSFISSVIIISAYLIPQVKYCFILCAKELILYQWYVDEFGKSSSLLLIDENIRYTKFHPILLQAFFNYYVTSRHENTSLRGELNIIHKQKLLYPDNTESNVVLTIRCVTWNSYIMPYMKPISSLS